MKAFFQNSINTQPESLHNFCFQCIRR